MSFVTRDLIAVLPRAKIAAVVPFDEILARVREAVNWGGGTPEVSADRGLHSAHGLCPERHSDPYAGFEPRIVPENVTLLPKTTAQVTGGNAWNERTVVLKKGDSVSAILETWARPRTR